MSRLKSSLYMLLWSGLGGAAGGFAAGLVIAASAVTSAPFAPPDIGTAILAIVVAAIIVLTTAAVGAMFGIVAGYLPTLFLGALMTVLNRWRPFSHPLLWAGAGAASGWLCAKLNLFGLGQVGFDASKEDLTLPWMVAGAVAMSVFQILERRSRFAGLHLSAPNGLR